MTQDRGARAAAAAVSEQLVEQRAAVAKQNKRISTVDIGISTDVALLRQGIWPVIPIVMLVVAFFVPTVSTITVLRLSYGGDTQLVAPRTLLSGITAGLDGLRPLYLVLIALLAFAAGALAAAKVGSESTRGTAIGSVVVNALLLLATVVCFFALGSTDVDQPAEANGGLVLFAAAAVWLLADAIGRLNKGR